MDWTDDAIVLSARRHGENAAIVQLLTLEHGRHAGLVRGGFGKRQRGIIQPGNRVRAHWTARLAEHLGHYTLEMTSPAAALLLDSPKLLAALSAACSVAAAALPEREPHQPLFDGLCALIGNLVGDAETPDQVDLAGAGLVRWELELLRDLGFGLDLQSCAVTGKRDGLCYVSPRTGRAVTLEGAGIYRDKLLPLPGFLVGGDSNDVDGQKSENRSLGQQVRDGLRLTGYFVDRNIFAPHGGKMPPARQRFEEIFAE